MRASNLRARVFSVPSKQFEQEFDEAFQSRGGTASEKLTSSTQSLGDGCIEHLMCRTYVEAVRKN